ncbi:hypothetical protein ACWDOP_12430 [Nocardia sp. NPDC003693]
MNPTPVPPTTPESEDLLPDVDQLREDADAAVAETSVRVVGRGLQLVHTAKRHPVPLTAAAASGAVLTWWAIRRRRS